MCQTFINRSNLILGSALLATAGLTANLDTALAQSPYRNCQPPQPGEYLLFVVSQTPKSRELVRRALPPNANPTVCRYYDDVVMRVSGFTSVRETQNWVRYMNDIAGLPAFAIQPPAPVQTETVPPLPSLPSLRQETAEVRLVSENAPVYNPQPLGRGYAVLVDYFNQPEIANQLQRLLGKEIGLVSYGERPYLLVLQTTNQRNAANTFQRLNERGFFAMLVDSQKVTLLRPRVLNQ